MELKSLVVSLLRQMWGRRAENDEGAGLIELLNLAPGQELLVLGLGPTPWRRALPSPLRVVLVDPRPDRILAWRRTVPRGGPSLELATMDLGDLDFASGRFDGTLLNLVLSEPADRRVLREAARVTRPGGRLLLCDRFLPGASAPDSHPGGSWRRVLETDSAAPPAYRVVLFEKG
jgi:ubiquinone/menaquinone biosynthesis C-methylase UbiE